MLVADFRKYIQTEVIGCPIPTVDQAVLLAAYEFCDVSGAWNELQDEVLTKVGVSQYDIDYPTQSIPLRIRDLWINGNRVTSEQMRNLPSIALGTPVSFNSANEFGVVTLSPAPAYEYRMQMRVVFAPARNATQLPDALMTRYMEAISAGAKSRLMLMPKVEWSNPQLATYYRNQFDAGVHDARNESIHDRASGSLAIVPRRFA